MSNAIKCKTCKGWGFISNPDYNVGEIGSLAKVPCPECCGFGRCCPKYNAGDKLNGADNEDPSIQPHFCGYCGVKLKKHTSASDRWKFIWVHP